MIVDEMWVFFNDMKINLDIHVKNDKLSSCKFSNPGYPDSDKK